MVCLILLDGFVFVFIGWVIVDLVLRSFTLLCGLLFDYYFA